ncbi:4-oxalocrotonate decarboxylase [Cupriavidus basilensis OR16]|uniref:4-oxalocrotonate decarboxylase n=1 Tax=Cupriavidus basilensis OR16 TaxID=1127483 RepID=H1SDX6_9BURK|nr:fumarylacetoacetate hydrolase family protein [Cupriavidus basilensis]EHP39235.1 4-oxalocrotonate decarboxylase [Cupriavidus basilensis OR16]
MIADQITRCATRLDDAARQREAIDPLGGATPFSIEDAYAIQAGAIALRLERGEQPIGIKLGFTSRAKMVQMGVDSLIWGQLTDAMLCEEGAALALDAFIHPRIEPEVCFLTARDIHGPLSLLDAGGYIEAVAPAMEIIDSRYRNFKFSLADVVADNCSSAALVVGPWSRPDCVLANCGVQLEIDGRPAQLGTTAAILGNPLRALVQASRLLARAAMVLPAGSLIMAGAATAAEPLRAGCHVRTRVSGLGQVELSTR